MLTGVILAAGEANRMGDLKQLLDWEKDNTILGKTVDNLLQAEIIDEELKIVVGAEKEKVKTYLEQKYSSQLEQGIIKIIENDGPEVYRKLFQKCLELEVEIFQPQYQGQPGHPVIIKNKFRETVLKLEGEGGLRNLFSLMPEKIYHYECNFKEITVDLDFKKEYQKYRTNNFKMRND